MTASVRYLREPGPVLRALPEYEPTHAPGETPPRRWSSLRPPSGPQLALVAPAQEVTITAEALWRLLIRILEVLEGRRNVGQLRALLSDTAYEALLTRLRTTAPGRSHRLRRLRTCYPSATAVEVAAVIDIAAGSGQPHRVCAMATRLERSGEAWHCAVLRLL